MRLDIFSDTICPWCFIGKRRLERALAARPQPELAIRWRAFQLNPDMPPDGMDRRSYLEAKFGGPTHSARVYDAVTAAGASEGIDFDFGRIGRTPNTLNSHRLLRFAFDQGRQDALVEILFRRYFIDGVDIGDRAVLVAAAAEAGLDVDAARRFIEGDAEADSVRDEDVAARRQGINGVPCFVFNGRFGLSGAQDPEVFFQLFDLAREDDIAEREAAAS
ncbi:MAG: DsbA family oxidoreductase [Dongiaceae bacterium]